jgi:hypothetical protein
MEDLDVLTRRAQLFLTEHAHRAPARAEVEREWYECTDLDGTVIAGPEGGLERLQDFIAQYGGLTFCQERPGCNGKHGQSYRLDPVVSSGWARTGSGGWAAEIGQIDGWPLMLDWATGRIGIDIHEPETWIAHSLLNLVESAALGQSLYLSTTWHKAVLRGHGPGWGVEGDALEHLRGQVPEVVEASSPWNHWLMDQDVAVHGWRATYEPARRMAAMAWYRTPEGRRRLEAVVGPLVQA